MYTLVDADSCCFNERLTLTHLVANGMFLRKSILYFISVHIEVILDKTTTTTTTKNKTKKHIIIIYTNFPTGL